jgi:TolA-binding protein
MKSLLGLGTGGAVVAIWEKLPWFVRYPLVGGLMMVGAAELNIDVNHALRAPQIYGGEAAKGDAQVVDPAKTLASMKTGAPVTGAAALLATQVGVGDADARQKGAVATAASESIEDIRAKIAKGQKPTTSELLQLREVEIKEQELREKTAEARIKEAQASAADATAQGDIAINRMITEDSAGDGRDFVRRAMDRSWRKAFGVRN